MFYAGAFTFVIAGRGSSLEQARSPAASGPLTILSELIQSLCDS